MNIKSLILGAAMAIAAVGAASAAESPTTSTTLTVPPTTITAGIEGVSVYPTTELAVFIDTDGTPGDAPVLAMIDADASPATLWPAPRDMAMLDGSGGGGGVAPLVTAALTPIDTRVGPTFHGWRVLTTAAADLRRPNDPDGIPTEEIAAAYPLGWQMTTPKSLVSCG